MSTDSDTVLQNVKLREGNNIQMGSIDYRCEAIKLDGELRGDIGVIK
jgi:hypothetical protein